MTREQMLHFRRELLTELTRLYLEVNRDLHYAAVERVFGRDDAGDEADEALRALFLEAREELDERDGARAQAIEEALERMRRGTYGQCIDDGRAIELARLEAVPWTPRCADDQRRVDEEERRQHAQPWPPTL
jgi:DnaK suppressor protein